jgi:hypothetical protein
VLNRAHTDAQVIQDKIFGMARSERTKPDRTAETRSGEQAPNPVWFKPIIVFYVSGSTQLPIPSLGSGNILVGFGIMFIGFLMTTRWR